MSFSRTLLVIPTLILFSVAAMAQETSLDLRKDGRVLTGSRKDFFVRQVKSTKYKVSDYLRNKVASTRVAAIVIPPGKTGDKFLIGVVPGAGTLPDDWTVTEDEFRLLRELALNKKMAQVETKDTIIRATVASGQKSSVNAVATQLAMVTNEDSSEAKMAASYAGYLLQDLPEAMEIPALAAYVTKYRDEEIRSLQPTIVKAIGSSQLAQGTPVVLTESDNFLSANDLGSVAVKRQSGEGNVSFLTSWYGRSLIIVPERPGIVFNAARHKNLVGYLGAASPTVDKTALVQDYGSVMRPRSFDAPQPN